LNSKILSAHKDFFARIAVDSVLNLDEDMDVNMIGIKKVTGGSMTVRVAWARGLALRERGTDGLMRPQQESLLVTGVAFKKTFSYAGYEQMPKKFVNPRIALLNVELELKAEKDNAEVQIETAADYQRIVDAEWNIIYEKLDKLHRAGVQVVLSRLPIGDLATQYFADRGLYCAGRVADEDMRRVSKATGGQVQSSVNDLVPEVLGQCGLFEERQIGGERFEFFEECPKARACTIVLRGGADQFIDEADRSLHDAIMIVSRTLKHQSVVAGAGAIEMELSRYLRDYARSIPGKAQLIINAYAKALEIIPRQLVENAGFDATNVLNKLRQKHAEAAGKWFGIDVMSEGILDAYDAFVWEPAIVKINALTAASEAAQLILSVDETVRNQQSEVEKGALPRGRGGMRGGRGARAFRGRGGR
jgi:T-complex protein 1 subunit eta